MSDTSTPSPTEVEALAESFETVLFAIYCAQELKQFPFTKEEVGELRQQVLAGWNHFTHEYKGRFPRKVIQTGVSLDFMTKWPQHFPALAEGMGYTTPETVVLEPSSTRYFTLVGSRDAPEWALVILAKLAELFTDAGLRGRSGMAPGSDLAGYNGAKRSKRFAEIGFDNYLPNNWYFNREEFGYIVPDVARCIYDAKSFTKTYMDAKRIAYGARGGFFGLGVAGIDLHTRNTFQVLGHTLIEPSEGLACWAPLAGSSKTSTYRVTGGTATAVEVANTYGIPILNLVKEEDRAKAEAFIADPTNPNTWPFRRRVEKENE